MRIKGLEPPRLSASDPKSDVATNYTISAGFERKGSAFLLIDKFFITFVCDKGLRTTKNGSYEVEICSIGALCDALCWCE